MKLVEFKSYINAVLVEIVEDHVVTLDGKKYLVMYQPEPEKLKIDYTKAVEGRPKVKRKVKAAKLTEEQRKELEAAIFAILNANPNSKSAAIRTALKKDFNLSVNSLTLSYALARMKKSELIEVQGLKHLATWSVKPPKFELNIPQTTQ